MNKPINYAARSKKAIYKLTAAEFLRLVSQAALTRDGKTVFVPAGR